MVLKNDIVKIIRLVENYLSTPVAAFVSMIPMACALFTLAFAAAPATYAQQACVDSDGDGWGWNGVASCLVDSGSTGGTFAASGSNSGGICVDSDGDGWGWNGSSSCLVAGGSVPQENPQNNPQASGAECVDPDGDGWGWDGHASCRVSVNSAAGPQSDSPQNGAPQAPTETGGSAGTDNVPTSGAFDRNRDLVALHFDHAPDPDDGHAAAAGYIVTQELDLNVLVVGGAYGVWNATRYVPASERLMFSIWGNQWLDAHNNRSSAVSVATSRWAEVLASGGDVWIAESGQSDFTADVVRAIQQQFPEIHTASRIHLIQHSQWNEDHADASDLSFVRSNTRYVRIADGNNPNSTADFRSETPHNFVNAASSGRYSGIWDTAFDYLSPFEKLDFSDTVELMHILGIGVGTIATVEQFAERFMR